MDQKPFVQLSTEALSGCESATEIAVFVALLSFRNNMTGKLNPSHKAIAAAAHTSEKTVRRVLNHFRERKWVTWVQVIIPGTSELSSNDYVIADNLLIRPRSGHGDRRSGQSAGARSGHSDRETIVLTIGAAPPAKAAAPQTEDDWLDLCNQIFRVEILTENSPWTHMMCHGDPKEAALSWAKEHRRHPLAAGLKELLAA